MKSLAKLGAALTLIFVCVPASAGDLVKLKAAAHQTAFIPLSFDGRYLVADVYGAGQGTQLGNFTYYAPHVFDFGTGTFTATIEIAAANGDVLRMETVGQLLSLTESMAFYTLVGGTGRFQNATGTGLIENHDGGANIVVDGTIANGRAR